MMPKFKPMMGATPKIKPPVGTPSFLPGLPIFPGPAFPLDKSKIKPPPKPKTMTKKPKDEFKPEVSGLGTLTLPFNGLGSLLPPPVGLNTSQSRKRKSGTDKPKTPKTPGGGGQNGAPKLGGTPKIGTPKVGTPKIGDDTKGTIGFQIKTFTLYRLYWFSRRFFFINWAQWLQKVLLLPKWNRAKKHHKEQRSSFQE